MQLRRWLQVGLFYNQKWLNLHCVNQQRRNIPELYEGVNLKIRNVWENWRGSNDRPQNSPTRTLGGPAQLHDSSLNKIFLTSFPEIVWSFELSAWLTSASVFLKILIKCLKSFMCRLVQPEALWGWIKNPSRYLGWSAQLWDLDSGES